MPFKSKKQKTYLAINEPEVYKKFKKEETMMYGKPMKKEHGGKLYKKRRKDFDDIGESGKGGKNAKRTKKPMKPKLKGLKPSGLMGAVQSGRFTKKPMGGKVYKVDNSGQQMVAKQYGGKIHG